MKTIDVAVLWGVIFLIVSFLIGSEPWWGFLAPTFAVTIGWWLGGLGGENNVDRNV